MAVIWVILGTEGELFQPTKEEAAVEAEVENRNHRILRLAAEEKAPSPSRPRRVLGGAGKTGADWGPLGPPVPRVGHWADDRASSPLCSAPFPFPTNKELFSEEALQAALKNSGT